jgi:putative tricarboxylic transport membrane protein
VRKVNIVISVIMIIFCGFFAFLIERLPDRNLPNTLGSDFMPWVLVICLFSLSLFLLLKNIFVGTLEKLDSKISFREGSGVLFLTAIVYGYVKAMGLFGFLFVTPVFIAILMLFTGSRGWKEVVTASILSTLGIYFFFQKVFQVQLPAGTLF